MFTVEKSWDDVNCFRFKRFFSRFVSKIWSHNFLCSGIRYHFRQFRFVCLIGYVAFGAELESNTQNTSKINYFTFISKVFSLSAVFTNS